MNKIIILVMCILMFGCTEKDIQPDCELKILDNGSLLMIPDPDICPRVWVNKSSSEIKESR